jgi:signal transduction histidine kinase
MSESFLVDTQIFRELGELLVGEDATALVELVKNSYDADATIVTIHGLDLDDPTSGIITVSDNGIGMTVEQFRAGFLTIAGRGKTSGNRRSTRFARILTGEKGVGRLAARKLARHLEAETWSWSGSTDSKNRALAARRGIRATINWDKIDECRRFSDIVTSSAVIVETIEARGPSFAGTELHLTKLRKRWSSRDVSRFQKRVMSFIPSDAFRCELPKVFGRRSLLFSNAFARGQTSENNFEIQLSGEFQQLESGGQADASGADWVLEIEHIPGSRYVLYAMAPSEAYSAKYPLSSSKRLELKIEAEAYPIGFRARIFNLSNRTWDKAIAGIRVYMNGFRVLPYGDPNNDWLSLDSDTTTRQRNLLRGLRGVETEILATDPEEETKMQRNASYWGAIAITREEAPGLEMLVNREGFAPSSEFEFLQKYIRVGVDLLTRVRVSASIEVKRDRRERLKELRDTAGANNLEVSPIAAALRIDGQSLMRAAREARAAIAQSDLRRAASIVQSNIEPTAKKIEEVAREMGNEQAMLRVLASIGAQQAGFSHEVVGLVSIAATIGRTLDRLLANCSDRETGRQLSRIRKQMKDLHHGLERQAIFLTDVTGIEARKRRSRQPILQRIESTLRLLERQINRRGITVDVDVKEKAKSPAMFPAELIAIITNVLSNAIKFAGEGGRIRISAGDNEVDAVLRIENTGERVNLDSAETLFRPFESTTAEIDEGLGVGMGLGLTITRSILDEYGAEIRFVRPSKGFATALEIRFSGV